MEYASESSTCSPLAPHVEMPLSSPVHPAQRSREESFEAEVRAFAEAMQDYKRRSGRMFPTWSETLEVLRSLGYEKTAPPSRPA